MLEIHKIESLGALDGPGLRTVIFLQGCPMRCVYCHNSDSWHPGEGRMMREDELFKLIMRYSAYTRRNGGVTFSGGEPLLQAKALYPLIMRLKAAGVHVALDTSGCLFGEDEVAVLGAVDLVILDIKANTDAAYISLTGKSMTTPMTVLNHLIGLKKPYWIRQVDYPELENKDFKTLDDMTRSGFRERLEILPYHTMGEGKRRQGSSGHPVIKT